MGKAQRTKGATFEREVCAALRDRLGIDVTRNIGQARDGGNDIDVGPWVIECKRRKRLVTLRQWMDQAKAAIPAVLRRRPNGGLIPVPVVVLRDDGGDPLVLCTLDHFLLMTQDWVTPHVAHLRPRPEPTDAV